MSDRPASVLYLGDSRDFLAKMDPCSIDAIVTDGPYELGFMGRAWDSTGIVYDPEFWRLCLRVLKPGGHLANFCATRTSHRMVCAVEDAGFEIRDSMLWMYGQGMPKSANVPWLVDRKLGHERKSVDAPISDEAKALEWCRTALSPAHEPIVLARKPLAGTIAETVLEYGTGGLNVDGCRLPAPDAPEIARVSIGARSRHVGILNGGKQSKPEARTTSASQAGRWPPNVLLSPETAAKLGDKASYFPVFDFGEQGRFFYAAKASRDEREAGCEHLPARNLTVEHHGEGSKALTNPRAGAGRTAGDVRNFHPTVKPVSLMRWLCRLITPPGGIVLDPFAGSGTTGIAAVSEGFDFIGIEMDPEHHAIAMARIEHAAAVAPETNRPDYVPPPKKQLGLFR